jgi:hypothetical protein
VAPRPKKKVMGSVSDDNNSLNPKTPQQLNTKDRGLKNEDLKTEE